nr:unnamed protein product [Callosobruchus chinensis]
MRFKLSLAEKTSHKAPVTCVGWSSTEEVYSAGDDGVLLSWSASNLVSTKVAQLPESCYPTDLHFLSNRAGMAGKHQELILLGTAEGKFHIMNKSGRIERSVDAHQGAILSSKWANDASGLLTAGEDGFIKIWSRSGMLRSTVVTSDSSIYSACWSPDSQAVAYTHGKCIVIKHLAPNTKPQRWKAHEGFILCLAWSSASELIVSGGEDCKYRVWDSQGRQLFSSGYHSNHITSVAWSPNGDLFAVGSYDVLRLCDYAGWSMSLDNPATGSIYHLSWSPDGTQVAGACANRKVIIARVTERESRYDRYLASVTGERTVVVKDMGPEATEEVLEVGERIVQIEMRYNNLVLTTPGQCYIYSTSNWNTPAIFDLKDGTVTLMLLCEKHMLLVEKATVAIYNYQGRLIASPKWPNMRLDTLRKSHISLSPDTLVVRDSIDNKVVHVIDLSSNRASNDFTSIQHSIPIIEVSLDQSGDAVGRTMAILDRTRDLHLVQVRSSNKQFSKLGRKIESFQWSATDSIVAAIQDTQMVVWYCPSAAFNSKLLKLCSSQYESVELGRDPRINDFVGNSVSVRRADGSLLNIPISPFPGLIHRSVQENKWSDALNLCRTTNNEIAWACLAVLATQSRSNFIDIAEEAYANINHHEKVLYLQFIKTLSSQAEQKAHLALLGGRVQDAESILLHNGMIFQAIYTNVTLHNWTRALDLAVKHKTHIDTVLYLRKKYLEGLGKTENNNKFSNLNDTIQIDTEKIEQKMENELKNRRAIT